MKGMGAGQVCVLCRRQPVDTQWRPFCSERCRNEDLARWVGGCYRIASDPAPTADQEAHQEP